MLILKIPVDHTSHPSTHGKNENACWGDFIFSRRRIWRLLPAAIVRPAVCFKSASVAEVPTAYIIMAMRLWSWRQQAPLERRQICQTPRCYNPKGSHINHIQDLIVLLAVKQNFMKICSWFKICRYASNNWPTCEHLTWSCYVTHIPEFYISWRYT